MHRYIATPRSIRISSLALMTLVYGAFPGSDHAMAQSPTDYEQLEELGRAFEAEIEAHRGDLYFDLLEAKEGPQSGLNANPDIQLLFIDDSGMPVYYGIDNLNAARTVRTDDVWPGAGNGFWLTGAGTSTAELGLWDAGSVRTTHQEFGGRVVQADAPPSPHWHATHTTGTVVAAGVDATARGMSYQASLSAYDWNNDAAEMTAAAAAGMTVSSHSYGFIVGWSWDATISAWVWYGDVNVSTVEDYRFGFYDASAQGWDQIAQSAPFYTIVKSSGNDHWEGPAAGTLHWHWDPSDPNNQNGWVWSSDVHAIDGGTPGFDTIPPKGNAKNVVTIGAVSDIPNGWNQASDVVITGFSSIGPTDDGRIKPDLVANGDQLRSTSDLHNADYVSASGTSMATPSAAGSINSLVRYYESSHSGNTPRAATMKALLVNAADEAGTSPGPDYTHGWGLMNTLRAAQSIEADSVRSGHLVEATLSNGATDEYYLYKSLSNDVLKVTISWTDPAGTPTAITLDPSTSMLVHDLDLRIERLSNGFVYTPWILDPNSPATGATKGDNSRDNVEQTDASFASVDTYKVTVSHKGTLASPQDYSIASTHPLSTCLAWNDISGPPIDGGQAPGASVAWGDYDNDGDDDLYIGLSGANNILARNDGGGTFTDVTSGPLGDPDGARSTIWGDYDNDGDLDLYVANIDAKNKLLRNDGAGSFTDVTTPLLADTLNTYGAAWGDYDNDGYLDLFLSVNGYDGNKLIHNEGNGTFADSTSFPIGNNGPCMGVTWVDYDNDGDLDVYVGRNTQNNLLLRNDSGSFTDVSAAPINDGGRARGMAWGDYDNDGDLDLFFGNDGDGNKLIRNDGGGNFTDVTPSYLLDVTMRTQCPAWGDYDNDGDLDLYLSNADNNMLFRNDGNTTFTDVTRVPLSNPAGGGGAAWSDMDADGDLDLYAAIQVGSNRNVLVESELCDGNNWFEVTLSGTGSNWGGIGSRVRIVAGGKAQIREISGGSSLYAQASLTAHFGLGTDDLESTSIIDTVQVFWSTGEFSELTNVASNQKIGVTEPGGPAADLADHDVGNVILSMTDQGILGFLDNSQTDGSGFIYPADGSNTLYVGSLWVAQCENYIANRDYDAEPEKEWVVSENPDGHVTIDYDGYSDQDIHAGFTDAGSSTPYDFFVRQESWAFSDTAEDDFVIVRYFIHNRADTTQTELRAGLFLDFDLGEAADDDEGAVDANRAAAYMTDSDGLYVGAKMLEKSGSPALANLTLISNRTHIWPQEYMLDEDKLAFIAGADGDHIMTTTPEPDDYSLLISAGPFTLAPSESLEVAFAIVGGSSLQEFQENSIQAQIQYTPSTDTPVVPWSGDIARLLPAAPNPFRDETAIRFELGQASDVRVEVFDSSGRRIRNLLDGTVQPGTHRIDWDGRGQSGRALAAGVYFLRLQADSHADTRRIVIVR